MPTDDDNSAALPGHEINRLVRGLRARLAKAENQVTFLVALGEAMEIGRDQALAERDALLRHCCHWNAFDCTWEAMVDPTKEVWEWEQFASAEEARNAVRKAAGLDRGEG